MNDLETTVLRSTLFMHADDAPDGTGLLGAVHARRRHRSVRRRAGLAGVLVAGVAAVAVPAVVVPGSAGDRDVLRYGAPSAPPPAPTRSGGIVLVAGARLGATSQGTEPPFDLVLVPAGYVVAVVEGPFVALRPDGVDPLSEDARRRGFVVGYVRANQDDRAGAPVSVDGRGGWLREQEGRYSLFLRSGPGDVGIWVATPSRPDLTRDELFVFARGVVVRPGVIPAPADPPRGLY